MKVRRRSPKIYRYFGQRGFTLIEMIVIVAVMGILAAVAAPSFGSIIDGIKVTQTVTELQSALQDSQRQAIRANQTCAVKISKSHSNGNDNSKGNDKSISGNCLTSGSPQLPDNVNLATNMQSIAPKSKVPSTSPSEGIEITFTNVGSAQFLIQSTVPLPLLPADPTGKVVASVANPSVQKKCVAISSTLGLTRVGIYTGAMTPAAITDSGVCTALDWKQQG